MTFENTLRRIAAGLLAVMIGYALVVRSRLVMVWLIVAMIASGLRDQMTGNNRRNLMSDNGADRERLDSSRYNSMDRYRSRNRLTS